MRNLLAFLALAVSAHAQPAVDNYLSELAESALGDRAASLSHLTKAQAGQRRAGIREKMLAEIGGLPVRSGPLQPRIVGSFTRPGYRVEKLVYQSLPGFHVTANVYVPLNSQPPFPALVGVAGHSANGKASATYQHVWITMARRGFLVLAFDPPGQGERSETLDPDTGASRGGIGVQEHILTGSQCLLTGGHIARYEIWDGMRAVDYLQTRRDVDSTKIAVAGNSGGGTQAAYLAMADPRLAAIVSSCYMTSWKQLWYKPGPQDAEQVFPGFLKDGFDFPDFAFAAAPKPFLMTTAIRDFFPIEGARRAYEEIRRFYGVLDAEAKAGYFEYDDTHGWSKPRREAAYRWLEQWLMGRESAGGEEEVETEPEQNLYVTPTGQVLSSFGGETTQSLNAKEALRLYSRRAANSGGVTREMVIRRTQYSPTQTRFFDSQLQLPENGNGKRPAILALNAAKEDIGEMLAAGFGVMAIRFPASSIRPESGYSSQWQTANRAFLVGRTLIGLQLSDVLNEYTGLAANPQIDSGRIRIYGRGPAAVTALHAAFLTPGIESAVLEGMPLSWLAATQSKFPRGLIDIVLPGVLRDYDLPDLVTALAPRPVWVVDARNPSGVPLLEHAVKAQYPSAHVMYRPEGWTFRKVYAEWMGNGNRAQR
ncbi:MAG: alpha/beta fold hydrolase [Bryobacterales bacterium]|nr:alpha/beta fold hydrolase [Bryobacterales bacterium]